MATLRELCTAAATHAAVTAEQVYTAVLAVYPDADAMLAGDAPAPEAIEVDYAGRLTTAGLTLAPGMVIRTPLRNGQKGPEASVSVQVGFKIVSGTLVLERASTLRPDQAVRYRLALTRRIGQGRTQVWLVRPVDPASDERYHAAAYAAGQIRSEVKHQHHLLDRAAAREWAKDRVGELDLQPIPGPTTIQPFAPPSPVEWEWCGEQKTVKVARLGCPEFPDYQRSGRAVARWAGLEGRYERTVVDTFSRQQHEEDGRVVDGHPGYVTREIFGVHPVRLDGDDVVAAYDAARDAANRDYVNRGYKVRSLNGQRSAAVSSAIDALRRSLPAGEIPEGSRREAELQALARAVMGIG